MEGRDIGSVVFPHADVKVYLDASPEERARRRARDASRATTRDDARRWRPSRRNSPRATRCDRTRAVSPLTRVDDAMYIDTTGVPIDEVVEPRAGDRRRSVEVEDRSELELRTVRSYFLSRPVVRRRRIEFPAVAIAFEDFVAALQFLIVLVLDAERLADVVDAILIGRRIVAARRFVADGVGVLPLARPRRRP